MTMTIANFTTISGHFFANCMSIFHKTEVQTVILVYFTDLKSDWFKGYDKNANISIFGVLQFCTKTLFRLLKHLKMTV